MLQPYRLLSYVACVCSAIVTVDSQVSLVADPLPQGQLCPGAITFTCVSRIELPTIRWFITDEEGEDQVALFSHNMNTMYPQKVPIDTPGVNITITSAISSSENTDNINFTSTLETGLGNLVTLQTTEVSCGSLGTRAIASTNFTLTGHPALTSSIPCSITAHQGRGCYEMPVSLTFITDHAVEEYEIEISPDPMSTLCFSGTVEANATYVCSGLEIGTLYNFTLNANNCDGQEGPTEMFSIHPQVPVSPKLSTLVATYGPATYYLALTNKSKIWEEDANNTTLTSISMTWEEDVSSILITERCVYDEAISYTVDVSDGLGTIASNVSLPHCNQSTCSVHILIQPRALRESYLVRIKARNIFGTSSHSVSVVLSSDNILQHSLKIENCTTYVMCTAPNTSLLATNNCTIKLDTDPSYPEDSPRITGPVNVWFELPLLQQFTDYYHQASVTLISGITIVVHGIFTTGDETSTCEITEITTHPGISTRNKEREIILTAAASSILVAIIFCIIFITTITIITCWRHGKKKLGTSSHVLTTNSPHSRVTELSLPFMNIIRGGPDANANLHEDVSDNKREGEDCCTYDEIGTSEVSRMTSFSQDTHTLREVRTEPLHNTSQDLYSHLNHEVNKVRSHLSSSPINTSAQCNKKDTTLSVVYAQVDKSKKKYKTSYNSADIEDAEYAVVGTTGAPEVPKISKALEEYVKEECNTCLGLENSENS